MAYPTRAASVPADARARARGAALVRAPPAPGRRARAAWRAAWRIEFAAYLGAGHRARLRGAAARGRPLRGRRRALRGRGRAARRSCCTLPVVAAAGLGDSWDLLVRYPLEDFADYQSLPFPLDYDGPLNTSSVGGFFSDSVESLLLVLPAARARARPGRLAAGARRCASRRERWPQVASAVFAIGMAHYLVTRPDVFHTAPLAVMVAVLAAWALDGRVASPRRPARAPLGPVGRGARGGAAVGGRAGLRDRRGARPALARAAHRLRRAAPAGRRTACVCAASAREPLEARGAPRAPARSRRAIRST